MTVEPSSAPRSCTVVYLTSSRPHLGHVSKAVLSVCTLCFSTAWTLDCNFCLKNEGKSEGFVCATVTLEPVSAQRIRHVVKHRPTVYKPRFSAPQHSQCRTFRWVPFVVGKRLPQSVQKTRVPIAAIVCCWTNFFTIEVFID
jgi:hypothetical protein